MGDALAICLMKLNNFTESDFASFIPVETSGNAYTCGLPICINSIKTTCHPPYPVKAVISEISGKRLGCTAVVKIGKLSGIITDGDIRRMLEKTDNISSATAQDIYSPHPRCIHPDTLATTAFEIMKANDITQLIVAGEDNIYLGVLHLHDLLQEGIL